ncbi:MAG: hypothetical protein OEO23_17120, partial [Gemmatimonadota bacterium]|nr:hypothetical protein [Gemmatimonadota bacterium]
MLRFPAQPASRNRSGYKGSTHALWMGLALVSLACAETGPLPEEGSALRDIQVSVTTGAGPAGEALDGRLIVAFSQDTEGEPLASVTSGLGAVPVFGVEADGWVGSTPLVLTDSVFGFPVRRLGQLPPGDYRVQAILNRYETFTRSDGHTVKLPPDRGEGQQWRSKPGNLKSAPVPVTISEAGPSRISLELTEVIPELPDPETLETEWVKFIRIRSELLSDFWGTDMYLGAWVLLPRGFDEHPDARYPLAVFHGHFPATFANMRVEPPDTTEPCVYSARFDLDCYNHVQ